MRTKQSFYSKLGRASQSRRHTGEGEIFIVKEKERLQASPDWRS